MTPCSSRRHTPRRAPRHRASRCASSRRRPEMPASVQLDLGAGDVHAPSAMPIAQGVTQDQGAGGAPAPETKKKRKKGDRRRRVAKSISIRADLAPGGSLHVRHLSEKAFYDAEGVLLTVAEG